MFSNQALGYLIIPLLIFLIRVADVSMGTLRIIFVSRGIRSLAGVIGFFEVLIWLFAISQIMRNLDSPLHYIAYAAGFGLGNFFGITIERKISLGNRLVRIVTQKDATELVNALKEKGYGITSINAEGARGPVKLIFSVVKRSNIDDLLNTIKQFNPHAFYTIEDVRGVHESHAGYPRSSSMMRFSRFGENK